MALSYLHERSRVLYVTEPELHSHPDMLDHARGDGLDIFVITSQEKTKLVEQAKAGGVETRMLENYVKEFNESFEYNFVDPGELEPEERSVLELTERLIALVGVRKNLTVLVSETMRLGRDDTEGVWDPQLGAIVIKRAKLRSPKEFAATLLHEVAHASTGTVDATREFESVLTRYLGRTGSAAITQDGEGAE
jgi:hypothetical protein